MYQFFVDAAQIHMEERRVLITGSDVNHIKNVLRMKIGEEINVRGGEDGREYRCAILELTDDVVLCELRFVKEESTELPVHVTLFQGLPKADKMETIIQKCVELGACEIVPVATKRAIVKLDEKKSVTRVARWQSIAEAAAKQSKRGIIPTVSPVLTFGEALQKAASMDVKLIPYELEGERSGMDVTREIIGKIRPGQSVAVFIGPEGGFDESEIEKAGAASVVPITLGKRILRTETAGMTVMSWLVYCLEQ